MTRGRAHFLNFLGFQFGWFACILGAAEGRPLIGAALTVAIVIANLAARRWQRQEVLLVVIAGALGFAADSALVLAGWIDFPAPARLGGPSPVWMVCLWLNLAVTLRASLGWLRGRLPLAAVLGLIGGPLSYWAGARLGAVQFGEPAGASLGAIGVEWLVAMPLLVRLASFAEQPAPGDAIDTPRAAIPRVES